MQYFIENIIDKLINSQDDTYQEHRHRNIKFRNHVTQQIEEDVKLKNTE